MLAALAIACLMDESSVLARPEHQSEFWDYYSEQLKAHKNEEKKCNLCHEGANKKARNGYGRVVVDKLKVRQVKDSQAIRDAFREAEKEPSDIPGKTFGDLINEGKLPNSR